VSHYTTIRIQIRDLDCLRKVMKSRGFDFDDRGDRVTFRKGNEVYEVSSTGSGGQSQLNRAIDLVGPTSRVKSQLRAERREERRSEAAKARLEELAAKEREEELKIQQQYAVEKVKEQLSLRGFNLLEEAQGQDGSIRLVASAD